MYLEKVEIVGFKSFADKIKLEVPQGITAIIGPNGSGKSNIADAIRWVLGEQNIKVLRGQKTQDIIFTGSEKRRALGYAEVCLYINNSTHDLKIDFTEVAVKRRIYRSGESEYLLNNSICRLKDIQEIFMDTGVGKEGYSIIGQGQIEKILSSKPEERRNVFEEAAGIYKYKVKRLETYKKLDKERENIKRVEDILSEIEQRIEPLRKEADKTKQYLTLKDRLKSIEINLFLTQLEQIEKDLTELNNNSNIVNNQIIDKKENISHYITQSTNLKKQQHNLQLKIDALLNETIEIEKLIATQLAQISIYEEKTHLSVNLNQQLDQDKDKLGENEKELSKNLQLYKTKLIAEQEQHISMKKTLVDIEQEFEYIKQIKQDKKTKLEEAKQHKISSLNKLEFLQLEISRNKKAKEVLLAKQETTNTTLSTLNTELTTYKQQLVDINEQSQQLEKDFIILEKQLLKQEANKNAIVDKYNILEKEYVTLMNDEETTKNKIQFLNQLKNEFEGYSKSVKEVLKLKCTGVVGVISDLIEVKKEYEIAISISLGSSVHHIVTHTEQDAKNIITTMKKKKIGRVTFLPRDTIKSAKNIKEYPELAKQPGFIGIASNLISYKKEDKDIISHLLGKIIIIDNMQNASNIAKKFNYKYKLVTLGGELFNIGGALSGGSQKANNLFTRSRELKECEQKLIQLTISKDETKINVEELKINLDKVNIILTEHASSIKVVENKQTNLGIEQKIISEKVTFLQNNKAELQATVKDIQHEIKKTDLQLSEDTEKVQEYQNNKFQDEESNKLEQELIKLETIGEEKLNKIAQCKMDIYKVSTNIDMINNSIINMDKQLQKNMQDINQLRTQKALNLKNQQDYSTNIADLNKQIIQLKNKVQQQQQAKLECTDRIEHIQKTNQNVNKNILDTTAEVSELEKDAIRLDAKKDAMLKDKHNLNQYIWQEYQLTPSACNIKKEFLYSQNKLKQVQLEHKEQIRQIGNVNVNAVEEYTNITQRFEFLTAQKEDIQNAEKTLLKLIDNLTNEMNDIFREQFKNIAENFGKVFKELFEGGSAFLELTDKENILESGIDIIVRPPGKKLQNMSLLSGGERTLTAIALLFGILTLKASPFCVLDEIEASLDEANVLRFIKYLKTLAKDTQFVVITHRKGTMEYANTLYGVTQQEKGVSAIVSVKLDEAKEYVK
ncbi:MAG: chromosome segregation protein SMC [Epulopiscium sp. Nuni2H_MBin003]|nr:MAG: chromosome segregation protein SMC [Epulopiscium sp. Nuni2H_MBin003]